MQSDDLRVQADGVRDPKATNGEERPDTGQSSPGLAAAAHEHSSVIEQLVFILSAGLKQHYAALFPGLEPAASQSLHNHAAIVDGLRPYANPATESIPQTQFERGQRSSRQQCCTAFVYAIVELAAIIETADAHYRQSFVILIEFAGEINAVALIITIHESHVRDHSSVLTIIEKV